MELPEGANMKPPRGSFISLEAFVFQLSIKARAKNQILAYAIRTLAFSKEQQENQPIQL